MMPDFVYVLTLYQYGQPQWVTVHPTREAARPAWAKWTGGAHTEDEWDRGWWSDGEDYEAHLTVADMVPDRKECEVTDCPTEGQVNERGVCEGCEAAMRGD